MAQAAAGAEQHALQAAAWWLHCREGVYRCRKNRPAQAGPGPTAHSETLTLTLTLTLTIGRYTCISLDYGASTCDVNCSEASH